MSSKKIGDLPSEVLFYFFTKFPVQILPECMLVCKQWYNLIHHPFFVDLHHSQINHHSDDRNSFLVFCHTIRKTNHSQLYLVDKKVIDTTSLEAILIRSKKEIKMELPLSKKIIIVGSSNGLLCLSLLPEHDSFYICNPITREILEIPQFFGIQIDRFDQYNTSSGFAFDSTTDMYKIVYLWCYHDNSQRRGTRIVMYTLGSAKEWKWLEDVPEMFCNGSEQFFLNGSLHFHMVDSSENYTSIGAIDITTEKFKKLTEPPLDDKVRSRSLRLLRDCLCLSDDIFSGPFHLWIMEEYGVMGSWKKVYSIKKKTLGHAVRGGFNVRTMNKKGAVLVQGSKGQGYYDLDQQEFKDIKVEGIPSKASDMDVVVHVGSLISPISIEVAPYLRIDV